VIPSDLRVYFSYSHPAIGLGAGKMMQLCSQQQVFIKQLPISDFRYNFNMQKINSEAKRLIKYPKLNAILEFNQRQINTFEGMRIM
jgi:hypothetical protein